jgi:cold shock CspA family protein
MTLVMRRSALIGMAVLLAFLIGAKAQQTTLPAANASHPSQPAASSDGPGTVGSDMPAATGSTTNTSVAPDGSVNSTGKTVSNSTAAEDNPYDPLLEPPPLPKGKPTLIGGLATSVDHVRNRLTVQPFGKGEKVKVFVDERSHIYRNGVETTVLGIHKGDRVYVDTMLDRDKVLAKNVRVITETGLAEVRGQVIVSNPEKGTISVRDQLSAKPVTFSVSGATRYSSSKGAATASDVQPGALINVQFSPRADNRDVAQEVTVLAKPGDNYIFSGTVTNLDMRSSTFFVDNQADEQSYEVHFSPTVLADARSLKIGQEVTARAVFDGKKYQATNIRVDNGKEQEGQESKAQ